MGRGGRLAVLFPITLPHLTLRPRLAGFAHAQAAATLPWE